MSESGLGRESSRVLIVDTVRLMPNPMEKCLEANRANTDGR